MHAKLAFSLRENPAAQILMLNLHTLQARRDKQRTDKADGGLS